MKFIQTVPNQRPGWVVFGEGRADPCYREMLEEMSGPDVEGWNEDSYVEVQKCFLVEGIYETTCMCV